jgi:stress response protein SCP2
MRQALLYSAYAAGWQPALSAGQTGSEPLRLRAFMTAKAKTELDAFDRVYRDRILQAVWQAIIDASRDPATKTAQLRNYEIYDALLQTQAMILASSKEANSATQMRGIGNEFAKRLRRLVAEFKDAYDRDGLPFDVMHTDKLQ